MWRARCEIGRGACAAPITITGGNYGEVSCTSTSFCAVVAGDGIATWDGSQWSDPGEVAPAPATVNGVSCAQPTTCVTYVQRDDGDTIGYVGTP